MLRFSSVLLIAIAAFFAIATAQSPLPPCSSECTRLRGQCFVRLLELSRTPCFDTHTKKERTCDCGISTLQQLAQLQKGEELRDCVINGRLFDFDSDITVNANLINVHADGISNARGVLRHTGDIIGSTICDWKCFGDNSIQNCILDGRVIRSHFRKLRATGAAALRISGPEFAHNRVELMTSNTDIRLFHCNFSSNTVGLFAMDTRLGKFVTGLGTSIKDNKFDRMALGEIRTFANIDGNTAKVASASGPCARVFNVDSPIKVTDNLGIPNDARCQKLFKKV